MAQSEFPNSTFGVLPETGFVRLPKILEVLPVSDSAWWAGIKTGLYPKGIKLGPRTTAWKVETIRSLILSLSSAEEECQ